MEGCDVWGGDAMRGHDAPGHSFPQSTSVTAAFGINKTSDRHLGIYMQCIGCWFVTVADYVICRSLQLKLPNAIIAD